MERQLAVREAPDLVVFYDGTNDINVLAEQGGEQPTVYNADDYRATVESGVVDADGPPVADEGVSRRTWDWWRQRSMVAEVARQARAALAVAPAAAAPDEDGPLSGEERLAAVPAAVEVYRRGRAAALAIAEDHDLPPPTFFWQPEGESRDPNSPSRQAAARVGEPTIDISDALLGVDPDEVFIDGGHTNELGALLVAQAMWEHLEPQLQDLLGDTR